VPIPSVIRDRTRREIERELDNWVKRIIGEMHPDRVILFGSAARQEAGEESDIDMVVVAESRESFFDRVGRALALYQGKRDVHVLVYTPAEWERMLAEGRDFARTVAAQGKLLYQRALTGP